MNHHEPAHAISSTASILYRSGSQGIEAGLGTASRLVEPKPSQGRVFNNKGRGFWPSQCREKEHTVYTTRSSRVLSTTAAVTLAITAFSTAPAFAGESGLSGRTLLRAQLVGSMPAPASPAIASVNPGGAPWVNAPSPVRVREDGRITVDIRGLVIPPPRGTGVNPVPSVVATLVCGNMVQDSTEPFALDMAGNGSTSEVISVPLQCEAPAVLIQPAANRTVYIASAIGEDG